MEKIFGLILLCTGLLCDAQIIVTPQLQKTGVVQKQQLWNMLLTNTDAAAVTGHIEIILGDNSTGQPILSGIAKVFTIAQGSLQVNAAMMEPIQYTQLNGNYIIDPAPNGFLPVGNFSVCISFYRHIHDAINQIVEECDFIEVEPLGPPQLTLPWDESEELSKTPTFAWLPPTPAGFFTMLNYDLDVVEILPGQSAADAIQQNIPLLHQLNIIPISFLYPVSAPALEYNKQYAWRITAKNNGAVVSKSEVWSFTLKQELTKNIIKTNNLPYSRLLSEDQPGYSMQLDYLKFEYTNEANDSTWNVMVYDVTNSITDTISMRWDTVQMKYGQNLVNLDLKNAAPFISNHFYLMELRNQWGQLWRLKFEFRRSEED
ncbi:MAG: hypothetical protein QM763_01965 [Agriterribacter sp.]